jgi:thiosulfate dehydrogenase [quinone] large subunit
MTTVAGRIKELVEVTEYVPTELRPVVAAPEEPGKAGGKTALVWAALRLAMGWTFFWAFADKLLGLGYATEAGKGWIDGGSPTYGFLNFASKGPLVDLYKGMAASESVEWLFMLGLLVIGLPLLLGVGVRIAGSIGIVMYTLMYTAAITPANNPFMDAHIIGIIIMAGLVLTAAGSPIGLGRLWVRIPLVKRYPLLK